MSFLGAFGFDVDVALGYRNFTFDGCVYSQFVFCACNQLIPFGGGVRLGGGIGDCLCADDFDFGRGSGHLEALVVSADGAVNLNLIADSLRFGVEAAAHVYEDAAGIVGDDVSLAAYSRNDSVDFNLVVDFHASDDIGKSEGGFRHRLHFRTQVPARTARTKLCNRVRR